MPVRASGPSPHVLCKVWCSAGSFRECPSDLTRLTVLTRGDHRPEKAMPQAGGPTDEDTRERLRRVWKQSSTPVVYRRGKGFPLLARLPYGVNNRAWLQALGRRHPVWDTQRHHWELPKAWFNELVRLCLQRYSRVYIIQPFHDQEKCAPACWNAAGEECQCSCMGLNHGSGHPGGQWKIVSDAFATRWGDRELACRLLTAA